MPKHKERIELGETLVSALMKLCEGNPGAVTACSEMMKANPTIDSDSVWGVWGPLLSLDTHGIYGHYIWALYKDVCQHSAPLSLALLRTVQMGIMSENELLAGIMYDTESYKPMGIERIKEVYYALKNKLPNFDPQGEGEKVWKNNGK